MIVVMVHRAAIQLDLTPANVLISYIIGVGGYFFSSSLSLNATLILMETNITPLRPVLSGQSNMDEIYRKVRYNSKTHSGGLTDYLLRVS